KAGGRLEPGRYDELRYEDLLADPEGRARDLCAFFDVEFLPEMLEFYERGVETLGVRNPDWHKSVTRPLQRGLRDWRTQMPQKDLLAFEVIAGRELEMFGYERAMPDPPTAFRLRTRASVISVEARKRVGRYGNKAKR